MEFRDGGGRKKVEWKWKKKKLEAIQISRIYSAREWRTRGTCKRKEERQQ